MAVDPHVPQQDISSTMKVFLSWSGPRSKAVAVLFNDWLRLVVQSLDPWISKEINKGTNWLAELTQQLENAAAGIVCLTNSNKDQPWILFEAGALAKGLSKNRVCTFLIDIKPEELTGPLAMFEHTSSNREELLKLLRDLNSYQPDGKRLDEKVLVRAFDKNWEDFRTAFEAALKNNPPDKAPPPRPPEEMWADILNTVRSLDQKLDSIAALGSDHTLGLNQLLDPYALPTDWKTGQPIKALVIKGENLHIGATGPSGPSGSDPFSLTLLGKSMTHAIPGLGGDGTFK
jgi:hypothetical protein